MLSSESGIAMSNIKHHFRRGALDHRRRRLHALFGRSCAARWPTDRLRNESQHGFVNTPVGEYCRASRHVASPLDIGESSARFLNDQCRRRKIPRPGDEEDSKS